LKIFFFAKRLKSNGFKEETKKNIRGACTIRLFTAVIVCLPALGHTHKAFYYKTFYGYYFIPIGVIIRPDKS
jgi:hypothetical protein